VAERALQEVVRWLSGIGKRRRPGTDGELLQAFATARDQSAFAELLRRHGPLVWSICARSLPRVQDAEDAFQATFLVLARGAGSIRKGEALASWLFGVARRAALRLRHRARLAEPPAPAPSPPDPRAEIASAEACDAILEEVRALPEKYRLPLLLCGLEGLTKREAARQLGWREGTVSGRLARARARLQARLARRGILTAGGLTLLAVPGPLDAQMLRLVTGQAAPGPVVAALVTEVLRSMRAFSLTVFTSVVSSCLLALALGGAWYRGQAAPAAAPAARAPDSFVQAQADETAAATWQERLVLRGYAGSGYAEFSPDGRTLATADGRNVLRFLDTATWQERSQCPLTKYKKGTYFPQWHPFSPDGRWFALTWRVPADDGKGKPRFETWLIEVATGKFHSVLAGKDPRFSPVGTLLSLSQGDTLVLYDYQTEREVRTLALGHPTAWRGDRFAPDGKRLFTATTDGRGKLWDPASGKAIATLRGYHPVWSKDGKTLATVVPGPEAILWDAVSGKERATLRGFKEPGCLVQLSPDGKRVLTSVSEAGLRDDGEISFPEFDNPYVPKRTPLDVRVWDAMTGEQLARLPGEREHCRGGAFAPDGKCVAYIRLTDGEGFTPEAVVWDLVRGKEQLVLSDEKGIDDIAFMPDGRLIGNIGLRDNSQLYMWEATTGRVLARIDNAQGARTFSPDGKLLVVSVPIPVAGPLTEPIPTPMEVRIFLLSNQPVRSETRGEPIPIKGQK
jgi:RNA polymerase sigma factor (sigma-70 family)